MVDTTSPIDICMLTCNRRRITEISITELARRTTTPYRLTVLDNGSVDDTPRMLSDLREQDIVHRLVLSTNNNGVHWGFNRLLEMVESEWYVCTDNDIVPPAVTPCMDPLSDEPLDWLGALLVLAEYNLLERYAAIACRPHVMIGEPSNRFDDAPEVREMSHCGAVLRLMRTDAVRQAGGWRDIKQASRNNEEWWICGKLRKAGWKVGYARDVRVIHQFGEGDGEDPWGYPVGTEHGHVDRWPPVNHYNWQRMKIDWETCEPREGK